MALESPIHGFARALADSLADRLVSGAPQNRQAMYLTLLSLIYAKLANAAGGEWVYIPNSNRAELEQARERIAQALQAGEPPRLIAQRERVTERHVRKIRGTIRP